MLYLDQKYKLCVYQGVLFTCLHTVSGLSFSADEIDFTDVAMKCENCTGADLKSLLVNAQLEAVHDVMNNQLFNQGRDTVKTYNNII